ncbi:hypothetical protein [Methanolapillus millepedarum]|uniref:Uncharacterized protein n=1 Tax=Methanolapillus millepedarum TaxID=3028296 RepID=A0AA96ZTU9_9EURY|nr:hypothetical protein MsAc7_04180 [Methanosarcinaceae archaeon Ac7]
MSMTKQEKLGVMNFMVGILAIITLKYFFLPSETPVTAENLLPLATYIIAALLVINIVVWFILLRYFQVTKKNTWLFVYEILFLLSLVALYAGLYFDLFPEIVLKHLLSGAGLFLVVQLLLGVFFSYSIVALPLKPLSGQSKAKMNSQKQKQQNGK